MTENERLPNNKEMPLACVICDELTTIEKRCPFNRKPKPQEKPCKTAINTADRVREWMKPQLQAAYEKGENEGHAEQTRILEKAGWKSPEEVQQIVKETYNYILDIENPCPKCGGRGKRAYSSTATWHGGIGGQAITNGICDECWGSGDLNNKWLNLRTLETNFKDKVQQAREDERKKIGKWLREPCTKHGNYVLIRCACQECLDRLLNGEGVSNE